MKSEVDKAVKKFGPLNGVVHAAGLPSEGILQLKNIESAQKILKPKVKGTLVLDEICSSHSPDFVVLCSSIASVLGGIGLGDYSAANSFLDAFASKKRSEHNTRFVAVNWDMWGEVGMGLKTRMPQELKEWFEQELQNGISSPEGLDALHRILSWNKSGNVVVSTRDLQVRIDLWIKREFIKEKEQLLKEKADKPKYTRPSLSMDYSKPQSDTEKKVSEIWGQLFGIEQIGREDNFYELGGHSLLATTLLTKLRREFGTTISIRDVLDNPSVRELSALVEKS
jgi:acyl carrier protein